MLRPTVIRAIPKEDYTLSLIFDNGETKLFNVKPYIKCWACAASLTRADKMTIMCLLFIKRFMYGNNFSA